MSGFEWITAGMVVLFVGHIVWIWTIGADRSERRRAEEKRARDDAWLAKVHEWNQPEAPHRGPCRCTDCVITEDDDPATQWTKAMRGLGIEP